MNHPIPVPRSIAVCPERECELAISGSVVYCLRTAQLWESGVKPESGKCCMRLEDRHMYARAWADVADKVEAWARERKEFVGAA